MYLLKETLKDTRKPRKLKSARAKKEWENQNETTHSCNLVCYFKPYECITFAMLN
jgi:hypothetical protein